MTTTVDKLFSLFFNVTMSLDSATMCMIHSSNFGYPYLRAFFCLLYALPSLTAFVLVVMVLQRNRMHFAPIFVHIFSLNCFYTVGCWICDLFFTRIFALYEICSIIRSLSGYYYLSIPYFLYNFFLLGNIVSATMIVLHQFTAIIFPLQLDTIWKNSRRRITVATILIPTVASFHILLGNASTLPLASGQVYIKVLHFYGDAIEIFTAPAANAVCGMITSVIIFTCTVASAICAFRVRNNTARKINKKAFFVACFIGLSSVFFSIYQISLWYARFVLMDHLAIDNVISVRAYVADICFLPLPWVLLLTKRPVRYATLGLFRRKKASVNFSVHF